MGKTVIERKILLSAQAKNMEFFNGQGVKVEVKSVSVYGLDTDDLTPNEYTATYKGYAPVFFKLPLEDFACIPVLPGVYDCTMERRVDAKNQIVSVPVAVKYVSDIFGEMLTGDSESAKTGKVAAGSGKMNSEAEKKAS
jgi:hypothetical protein